MPNSRKEAFNLLEKLGAPEHLKTHATLVGEAADLLIDALRELGVEIDFEFVRTGVAIHDIGKIVTYCRSPRSAYSKVYTQVKSQYDRSIWNKRKVKSD